MRALGSAMAFFVLFVLSSAGCGCSGSPPAEALDASLDSAPDVLPDAVIAVDRAIDSGYDASIPRDAFFQDGEVLSCSTPLQAEEIVPGEHYRLPLDPEKYSSGPTWNDRQVVYSNRRCPEDTDLAHDLYVFDLVTLQESLLVTRLASQRDPGVGGSSFIYVDYAYADSNSPANNNRSELTLHDLASHSEVRLTDSNAGKRYPHFNGRHVVYEHLEWPNEENYVPLLRLLDVVTYENLLLAGTDEYSDAVASRFDIGPDHVAWTGLVPEGVPDIYVYQISTRVKRRLNTTSGAVLWPVISDKWVVWSELRGEYGNIYGVDLQTWEEHDVVVGDHDKVAMHLSGDLLAWLDYRHAGCELPCSDYDLYIKDMETGVERRLTSESRWWGLGRPSCEWLLYGELVGTGKMRLFAWNMVDAGVMDQSCHVIPCDPQTEQCAMISWRGVP